MRVLVVDDDKFVLELASEVLSMNGFDDVTLASSGADAIDAISDLDGTFDAIFLDIQMPGMDGIEVCARIRSRADYRSQPIIMLTAMQDKSYVNSAFAKGATDYVTKPFDPFDLGMRLERNLREGVLPTDVMLSFRPEVFCQETDGLVTFESAKNYLRQMKRCAVETAVVALRIENFETLQSDLSEPDFLAHLRHVARVLANHLGEQFSLTTLLEKGTFLVVSQGPASRFDNLFRADFESSVNLHMSQKTCIRISEALRCRKFKEVDHDEVIEQIVRSLEMSMPGSPSLSQFGLQKTDVVQ